MDETFLPSENFKKDLREWDRINGLIKEYETNLKELRKEKKKFQENTVSYMANNEIDACNLEDGKIILKKSRTKISVTTKAALPEKIKQFFMVRRNMDENIARQNADEIVNFIHSNPEYKESMTLVRTKKRNLN